MIPERVQRWHIPLSEGVMTLRQGVASLAPIALQAHQVPFLVRLLENPEIDFPGIELFHGATSLQTHDLIHMLLGRGLLAKDEAFVVGFTMGSTDRVSATEEKIFTLFARYLYPKGYRFSDEDVRVFRDAVRLGFVSDCQPLHQVDYAGLLDLPLEQARKKVGLEADLLRAYYAIEKKRYPGSLESQRLS